MRKPTRTIRLANFATETDEFAALPLEERYV